MPDIKSVYDETVEYQRYRHDHPEDFRGFGWFASELNSIIGRIMPGYDCRVAGEPKVGKTATMISQAVCTMDEGGAIFYSGLEENDQQLMLRMITNAAKVERNKFRDLAMADGDWQKVEGVRSRFHEFKGKLEYGLTTLAALKKEILKTPELDIVFIDHMNLMEPEGRWDSMAQGMGEISRGIKLLTLADGSRYMEMEEPAVKYKKSLITFTAVHLNDDGKYLWSRGSGRDGDVVLRITFMKDPAGNVVPNKRWIGVDYSRHSASGDQVQVMINGALSLVGSPAEMHFDINQRAETWLSQPPSM